MLPMVCSSDRIMMKAQNYVRRYLGTEFGVTACAVFSERNVSMYIVCFTWCIYSTNL